MFLEVGDRLRDVPRQHIIVYTLTRPPVATTEDADDVFGGSEGEKSATSWTEEVVRVLISARQSTLHHGRCRGGLWTVASSGFYIVCSNMRCRDRAEESFWPVGRRTTATIGQV